MADPRNETPVTLHFGSKELRWGDSDLSLHLPIPILGGGTEECIEHLSQGQEHHVASFRLVENTHSIAGIMHGQFGQDLEEATFRCYQELLGLLGQHSLYRVWHYIPEINQPYHGLERYRSFNIGRARAFERAFGSAAESRMPAASAVGIPGPNFVLAFVAGNRPVRYLENPEQTPAYRYPEAYGPRPPSFSRATVVAEPGGSRAWISGTASIKGCATVGVGDIAAQLKTTASNLDLIVKEIGMAGLREATLQPEYRLKVYLRKQTDLDRVEEFAREQLGARLDNAIFLQTEICRQELDLEIEMAFSLRG